MLEEADAVADFEGIVHAVTKLADNARSFRAHSDRQIGGIQAGSNVCIVKVDADGGDFNADLATADCQFWNGLECVAKDVRAAELAEKDGASHETFGNSVVTSTSRISHSQMTRRHARTHNTLRYMDHTDCSPSPNTTTLGDHSQCQTEINISSSPPPCPNHLSSCKSPQQLLPQTYRCSDSARERAILIAARSAATVISMPLLSYASSAGCDGAPVGFTAKLSLSSACTTPSAPSS